MGMNLDFSELLMLNKLVVLFLSTLLLLRFEFGVCVRSITLFFHNIIDLSQFYHIFYLNFRSMLKIKQNIIEE